MKTTVTVESKIADFAQTEVGKKALAEINKTMCQPGNWKVGACFEDADGTVGDALMAACNYEIVFESGTQISGNSTFGSIYRKGDMSYLLMNSEEYRAFSNLIHAFGLGPCVPMNTNVPDELKMLAEVLGGTR